MRLPIRIVLATGLAVAISVAGTLQARQAPTQVAALTPAAATGRIVASARALIETLDAAGRAKVQFPFDGPQKARWSNFPSGIFKREGLRLGDLTSTQRTAAMNLLTAAFSRSGYQKVTEIMRADEVFRETAGAAGPGGGRRGAGGRGPGGPPPDGGPGRGPAGGMPGGGGQVAFGQDEYYLAFVGTPSTTAPWMLQFGGHHLAINLTLGGDQASMAPSLTGVQPATYTIEGRTVRPLGAETDKAFALINALDSGQRSKAILNYDVRDLVLGPGADGRAIQPEGLLASSLTPPQQTMLLAIVREWVGIAHDAYAEPRMADIRSNLPRTYFAWSGPTTPGSASYYRIQGPTLVIEYAPQGDTDHIHTIYRDPANDYGAAFARK